MATLAVILAGLMLYSMHSAARLHGENLKLRRRLGMTPDEPV